jgi:hypothetical protein
MPIDQAAVNDAKKVLEPDEYVELTVEQRHLGPGGSFLNPTIIIATSKRLLIMNRATLGVKTSFEIILYANITSVKVDKGIFSSSLFIKIEHYDTEKGMKGGKEEMEVDGLNTRDAQMLADLIDNMLFKAQEGKKKPSNGERYCAKCGARNDIDAHFCDTCGNRL